MPKKAKRTDLKSSKSRKASQKDDGPVLVGKDDLLSEDQKDWVRDNYGEDFRCIPKAFVGRASGRETQRGLKKGYAKTVVLGPYLDYWYPDEATPIHMDELLQVRN